MQFSVIVPFRNARAWLPDCLDALSALQFPPEQHEILLVDNGSSDGGADGLPLPGPRFRLLREPVRGAYAARNRAAREASGEWLVFTDVDCRPNPRWLHRFAEAIQERPEVGVWLADRNAPKQAGFWCRRAAERENRKARAALRSGTPYGFTNNQCVHRPLFEELGGFRQTLRGGDTLLVQQARRLRPIGYVEKNEVTHGELSRFSAYLQKLLLYGWSAGRLDFCPPTLVQAEINESWADVLLGVGSATLYHLGFWAGRCARKLRPQP